MTHWFQGEVITHLKRRDSISQKVDSNKKRERKSERERALLRLFRIEAKNLTQSLHTSL